ncbi:Kinesin-4 protein [Spatholobus suberectus]|nr:Kinesin-4 protein [Spatholobus suberectus]
MATEQVLTFSLASVVEDVLQQHGGRLDVNLASRKAEEASLRRYEAAGWLRKTVGVVGGKDLPAEPSEEDFRIGLRSGIILCNVLNKIQPGSVPKVVEGPCDSVIIPDGAALSAYQYFENVRNFLVTVEEMGLPTFEASDLEQGGKSSRIVNCVLALKSYAEWKLGGGNGSWKYGGVPNQKPPISGKSILRKNSEPFTKSLWTMSSGDRDGYMSDPGHDRNEKGSISSLNSLVREYLSDKKPEEIPIVVEALLSKVMEEFEHHMQIQQETCKTTQEDKAPFETECSDSISEAASVTEMMEEKEEEQDVQDKQEECYEVKYNEPEESSRQIMMLKQQNIVEQQNRSIKELKSIVHQTKLGMQFMQNEHQKEIINLSKHLHSLASASSGYHKVLEENRKLYNLVQDLKGNIRVYCRVRPFLGGQPSHYSSVGNVEEGSISIITPSKYGKEGKKTFNFNRAFGPSATQGEVFSDMQPLIRCVVDGYNVCIFAYGQTGSGKTFTMSGPDDLNEETIGVNYRALRDLFYLSEQRKDTISYEISVQMLEIYNEQVRDLLATDGSSKRLEIRNSSHNGINVPDANLVPVSCTSDVINLMNLGHKNRAVGSTAMNDRSSRSHSCLTVHVQGKNLTSGSTIRGSMHLVDLAGSERADKTEATGDRLKEAQHINKSLSALGDVISSLAQKNAHVPYRNSKLTQLLQDSLGGQAKTLMFVHVSPEPEALGETLSTLKFAERVSTVELGAARVNKDSADVKELKEQIASLKAALARKEGGEAEHFQQSVNSSSHEIPKLKSNASSPPIQRSWTPGARKLPKDDSSSLEGQKNAASKLKRRSLDLHDMRRNSPPWPHVRSHAKEDDKESISGDWVDKISMNRNDSLTSDDSLVGQWEAESKQSSPMLSPTYLSEPSKIYPDHSLHRKDNQDYEDLHRHGFDMATTDESDDHEIATSDSSESDLHWPSHIPKPITVSSGLGAKAKKSTNLRPAKNPEARSMIPSLIPVPSRKQPTLGAQARKNPGSIDGKRRIGSAK